MSTICQTPSFCNALVAPNINFIAQYLYIQSYIIQPNIYIIQPNILLYVMQQNILFFLHFVTQFLSRFHRILVETLSKPIPSIAIQQNATKLTKILSKYQIHFTNSKTKYPILFPHLNCFQKSSSASRLICLDCGQFSTNHT